MAVTGTLVNAGAILLGGTMGLFIRSRLPERYVSVFFQAIGLFTLGIGLAMALESQNMMIVVVSIVTGAVAGTALDLENRLERGGERLKKYIRLGKGRFTEGFVTASMLYCVGSMAILGSIEEGLGGTPDILFTKSLIDGVAAIALGAAFGAGVMASVIPVFVFQGAVTVLAGYLSTWLDEGMIAEMTAVGGLLLAGLGIRIMEIRRLEVTNMIPAVFIAPVLAYFFG